MKYRPMPQQVLMERWLLQNKEAALFVDMGLGKTAATLSVIARLILDYEVKGVLIVAPLRVALLTWPAEIAKYDEFKWMRVADLRTWDGKMAWEMASAHIYIINYDQLQRFCDDVTGLNRKPETWPVDMVVWDELSKAKNPKSKRIRAFLPWRQFFQRHVGLTGTPTPNSYLDLHPQIRLLDGGKRLGASFYEYQRRYFESDWGGYNWEIKPHSKRLIENKLGDIALTLRAEEFLDVPITTTEDVEVRFPPELMKRYRKFEKDLLMQIENKEIVAVTMASLVNKLLQFTSGAIYDVEKVSAELHNLKTDALKELLKKLDGPALVAFHYKHERERILRDIPFAEEFSNDRIDAWNRGDIACMIGHPQSIGHGLNLQAGGRHVIWYSLTYSRELYDQYNARLVRTGQKLETNIYRLIVPRTVDDAVAEALRVKGDGQAGLKQALVNIQVLAYDKMVSRVSSH
jgi:hypothetical protein